MTWLVIIVLALLIPEILSTVLDSRLGRAVAARLEQGAGQDADSATRERIHYLEGEVDRLSEEVGRLSEESEFLHNLLAERKPGGDTRLPPGERDA
ncbi:MAG: hypothetical protein ACOCUZ_00520 [bacterium]